MTKMYCAINGCSRLMSVRSWCTMHYERWRRHGNPEKLIIVRAAGDAEQRFWAKVEKTEGCWNWVASRNNKGYGHLGMGDRRVYAHRYSYELHKGAIPSGLHIDHLCRNRSCVNPDHLEPVTNRENVLRGAGLTAQNASKTHCKRGHEFTEENVYRSPGRNDRQCRTCKRYRERIGYRR